MPFGGAVHGPLQRVRIGYVAAADVDAFPGQQRRQFLQQLIGHAGLELDLRRSRGRFGGTASHVWHAAHCRSPAG
ncbi:MAG: hypothetical protein ACRDNZ_10015 [Streptosporangiaceae bacterium]